MPDLDFLASEKVFVTETGSASDEHLNILKLNFDHLINKIEPILDDPLTCSGCGAFFSSISLADEKIWRCEYCNQSNTIESAYSLSSLSNEMLLYLPGGYIDPSVKSLDDKIVIFCIDTSNSMSSSIRV